MPGHFEPTGAVGIKNLCSDADNDLLMTCKFILQVHSDLVGLGTKQYNLQVFPDLCP